MAFPLMPWPPAACSAAATPTPSTPGSPPTCTRACPGCSPTSPAATAGGAFSHDQRAKQELQERLHQGPGAPAQKQVAVTPKGPPPSRWTLGTIRASFDWLADYTP